MGLILAALIALHLANGRQLFLLPGQIVGVFDAHGLGGKTDTVVTTLNGSFNVRETLDEVVIELRKAKVE